MDLGVLIVLVIMIPVMAVMHNHLLMAAISAIALVFVLCKRIREGRKS